MAMWPNPCVRVCVSVSRVPAGRMEMESLPATRRVGVAAPLSVFRPAALGVFEVLGGFPTIKLVWFK